MTLGSTVRTEGEPGRLVGRFEELVSLEHALVGLEGGHPSTLAILGEPGIGKTRLLRELADRGEQRGYLVLAGSASEPERDLPFSPFVHALDEYLESLDPQRLSTLDDDVQAELAHVFPSLTPLAKRHKVALQHERYRSHRAVRVLLEQLAEPKALVLVLDDLHWADSASVELVGALLRRPPAAAVLIALALRSRHVPERLASALAQPDRAPELSSVELGSMSIDEARELFGAAVAAGDVELLYEQSGGNPFYLEQLARSLDRPDAATPAAEISLAGVPAAVVASLGEELSPLSSSARLLLEGAAVAGDPFEPELAAAAAATSEPAAIDVLDELLRLDLIRSTDVPRRFRFRHPLVRRAVYESSAAAWRLGAHERCAEALAARGASALARAHHVDRSARAGDLGAVAVLREAGEAALRLAPASAARWFDAALRLLPETVPAQERTGLLLERAGALAADGHFVEAREALQETLTTLPNESTALRTQLTAGCARVEYLLGLYEQAHARLSEALAALSEPVSPEAASLMLELALVSVGLTRYEVVREWAGRALDTASLLDDEAPLKASALAMVALADAMRGCGEEAEHGVLEAASLIDTLSDDELASRLDAAIWLASAELYSDRFSESDRHIDRALTVARATGQGEVLLFFLYLQGRVWYVRGKLRSSTELIDGAIEAARVLGNDESLAWSLYNRSAVALASGDLSLALATAEESVELLRGAPDSYVTAWAGVRLAAVVAESGHLEHAADLVIRAAGGEDLALIPAGWRAYCLELLTRWYLELDEPDAARDAAARAEACALGANLPMARAWAARAVAAVELQTGEPARAVRKALASAAIAEEVGAPIEAALARTLAGRALAQAGDRDRAVVELQQAAATLEACGALRYRDQAERELGKLGNRTYRRTRPGNPNGKGLETLTARELQVVQLVVDRHTNPQIAAQLFLSNKTIETHLRNIFRKMDVSSRVELARVVERATQTASTPQT
jgi:ATP/maltotriose-dependent transcriptional regulator MalT